MEVEAELKTYRIRITRAVQQELYLEIEAEDKDAAIEEAESELSNYISMDEGDWEDIELRDDPEVDITDVKEIVAVGDDETEEELAE